ncbi:MAG: hypothetical protein HYX72_05405 [Acidobacteria bacterium]|nr:hypothetical protein [Acidobacteriota bacterium]
MERLPSGHGEAALRLPEEVSPEIRKALMSHNADKPEVLATVTVVECTLRGRFLTYGIGVPMLAMRNPEQAHGYAPAM